MITKQDFEFYVAIIGLIATIPIYKGWLYGALSWNQRRRKEKLLKERDFLTRLHTSDREFLGWLLHCLLLVVTIFCVALMFRAVEVDSGADKLVAGLHWLLGGGAYLIAVSALGTYRRLHTFEKSIAKINEQISKLGGGLT